MISRWMTACLAVLLVALVGCGASTGEDNGSTGTGADVEDGQLEHDLVFNQVGGIAGRDDWLTIEPSGGVSLETMAPHEPVETELDDAQLAELTSLVAQADLEGQADEVEADDVDDAMAFYIDYGDAEVAVGEEDTSQVEPLVDWLRDLVEELRPSP